MGLRPAEDRSHPTAEEREDGPRLATGDLLAPELDDPRSLRAT
jgi:hypothetical protein